MCNISSVSKLVKRLTAPKYVCLTNLNKGNICNASIVNQHVKPLNFGNFMNSLMHVIEMFIIWIVLVVMSNHWMLVKQVLAMQTFNCKSSNKFINDLQVVNPFCQP